MISAHVVDQWMHGGRLILALVALRKWLNNGPTGYAMHHNSIDTNMGKTFNQDRITWCRYCRLVIKWHLFPLESGPSLVSLDKTHYTPNMDQLVVGQLIAFTRLNKYKCPLTLLYVEGWSWWWPWWLNKRLQMPLNLFNPRLTSIDLLSGTRWSPFANLVVDDLPHDDDGDDN